ncbi:hypothetical protein DPMN_143860 [Dreissena polymorpha]|uniref:Uncharacterized protein n=1 Tax=Dreissena polymorpha TaxID=45954 RepID=A0A9D4GH69_DREPO|nr:hypothetical protein DPMN_143860 [Dreissena polymorpha]
MNSRIKVLEKEREQFQIMQYRNNKEMTTDNNNKEMTIYNNNKEINMQVIQVYMLGG